MSCVVETLTAQYDQSVRKIIEQVGAEFGAVGEGYGPSDPEVLCMSQHYGDETKSVYLVALLDGEVVGGCGLASFNGSSEECELKKLFILPKGRGHGLGKKMSRRGKNGCRSVRMGADGPMGVGERKNQLKTVVNSREGHVL